MSAAPFVRQPAIAGHASNVLESYTPMFGAFSAVALALALALPLVPLKPPPASGPGAEVPVAVAGSA